MIYHSISVILYFALAAVSHERNVLAGRSTQRVDGGLDSIYISQPSQGIHKSQLYISQYIL